MKQYVFFLIVSCYFIACNNESIEVETRQTDLEMEGISLSRQAVLNVANTFYAQQHERKVGAVSSRATEQVKPILDENNDPLAYVVNHEEGGWTMVSATKEYYPILAYSDTLSFQLNHTNVNLGLDLWLNELVQIIRSKQNLDSQTSSQIALEWLKYTPETQSINLSGPPTGNSPEAIMCRNRLKELNGKYSQDGWSFMTLSSVQNIAIPQRIYDTADQYSTPYEYTIVGLRDISIYNNIGPLLTTLWEQENNYNALCPNQSAAGCVPIAMAQIMNFHKFPATFDWNNMQDDYATYASQYLIAHIGKTIGADYGTDNTSSNISDAKKGFEAYGYNAVKKEHKNSDVSFEIANYKRPVYMRGQKGLLTAGHAWVCDGLKQNSAQYDLYVEYVYNGKYDNLGLSLIDNPDGFGGISYSYYHMNWGWGGKNNGWFIHATPNPETDFNYNRENLYIKY